MSKHILIITILSIIAVSFFSMSYMIVEHELLLRVIAALTMIVLLTYFFFGVLSPSSQHSDMSEIEYVDAWLKETLDVAIEARQTGPKICVKKCCNCCCNCHCNKTKGSLTNR